MWLMVIVLDRVVLSRDQFWGKKKMLKKFNVCPYVCINYLLSFQTHLVKQNIMKF